MMKSTRDAHRHKQTGGWILLSALSLGLLAFGPGRDTTAGMAEGPPDFDLSWFTINGGGVMQSTGGDFELSATMGQPDAGAMTGGDFEMTGGFWFRVVAGDCNADGVVNLLDYEPYLRCVTGPNGGPVSPECACFDLNDDDDVDFGDFSLLQPEFNWS